MISTGTSLQQTRDSIGSRPAQSNVFKIKSVTVVAKQSSVQVVETNIGHGFILNSGTNGVLGTWNGTEDGFQLLMGSGNTVGQYDTVVRTMHSNNEYFENFRFDNFNTA